MPKTKMQKNKKSIKRDGGTDALRIVVQNSQLLYIEESVSTAPNTYPIRYEMIFKKASIFHDVADHPNQPVFVGGQVTLIVNSQIPPAALLMLNRLVEPFLGTLRINVQGTSDAPFHPELINAASVTLASLDLHDVYV